MKFRGWEVQTQNITMTIIYISFKNLLTKKSDLAYTYYLSSVEAIIKHQNLRLTCAKLRSSCTTGTSYKELLTSDNYYNFFSPLRGKIHRK